MTESTHNILQAKMACISLLTPYELSRLAELAVFFSDAAVPEAAVITLWHHTAGMRTSDIQALLKRFHSLGFIVLHYPAGLHAAPRMFLPAPLLEFAERTAVREYGSIARLHTRLLEAYRDRYPEGWTRGPDDGYFLQNLCRHLVAAGTREPAVSLLSGYPFIERKVAAGLTESLIRDYDGVLSPDGSSGNTGILPETEALRHIQGAIRLSAHILKKNPGSLSGQLYGRLMHSDHKVVRDLLDDICTSAKRTWLRPVTPALTQPGGPLFRTITDHEGEIRAMGLLPDGRRCVSVSADGVIVIRDLEDDREILVQKIPHTEITAAVFTPDKKYVLLGQKNGTVRVWDTESLTTLHCMDGHWKEVTLIVVSEDGRKAVTASRDLTLIVWDLCSGSRLHTLKGHGGEITDLVIFPEGKRAVSASRDNSLMAWDLVTGERIHTLLAEERQLEGFSSLTLIPRSSRVMAIHGRHFGQKVLVWDIATGKTIFNPESLLHEIAGTVILPDGKRAVSHSWNSNLLIWDLETGEILRSLEGHSDFVSDTVFTSDGRRLISASWDSTLILWDLESGKELRTFVSNHGFVYSIHLMPDGKRFISTGQPDYMAQVWDIETGETLNTFDGHTYIINAVVMTADCRKVVTGSLDSLVRIWNPAAVAGKPPAGPWTGEALEITIADDRKEVVIGYETMIHRVLDLETGAVVRNVTGSGAYIAALAFSSDGKVALYGLDDKVLEVWDLNTGKKLQTLEGHFYHAVALAVTPDAKRAISTGEKEGYLNVWDLEAGKQLHKLCGHDDPFYSMAISADGNTAVSGSEKGQLKLWDLKYGRVVETLESKATGISSIRLSPDGKWALYGSKDGSLHLWDVEYSDSDISLPGQARGINTVAISLDAKCGVSGSTEGVIELWDLENRTLIAEFQCDTPIVSCAYSTVHQTIVAAGEHGKIYILKEENGNFGCA